MRRMCPLGTAGCTPSASARLAIAARISTFARRTPIRRLRRCRRQRRWPSVSAWGRATSSSSSSSSPLLIPPYAAPVSHLAFRRGLHSFNEPLITEKFQLHEIVKSMVHNEGQSLRNALGNIEDAVAEHLSMMEAMHINDSLEDTSQNLPAAQCPPSRLARMIPNLHKYGKFFTLLPLRQAYDEMNSIMPVSSREHVPVSFHEIRYVFNLAQVIAIADSVKLLTFDGDKTLYSDRSSMTSSSPLIHPLRELLRSGIAVALVTAVGSPDPAAFEERLQGLLEAVKDDGPEVYSKLFVVGGQCNYLFRCEGNNLVPVPDEQWKDPLVLSWSQKDVDAFLDLAASTLDSLCRKFKLQFTSVRKPFATGILYNGKPNPSLPLFLDEIAFEVRDALQDHFSPAGLRLSSGVTGSLAFCTFNGGLDVFVDVGSKAVGIRSLQKYLGLVNRYFVDDENAVFEDELAHTLHTGDQFTRAGNDLLARKVASTLWVSEPDETLMFVERLIQEIKK